MTDRKFHSPKLGYWLNQRQLKFCLHQKKSGDFSRAGGEYQTLKDVEIQPGQSYFWTEIWLHKQENLEPMNPAIYWKRKSRGKGPKAPSYILRNLDEKEEVLSCYRSGWGIETMFKDCKSGGYHLKDTRASTERLMALVLLITLAYVIATRQGDKVRQRGCQK